MDEEGNEGHGVRKTRLKHLISSKTFVDRIGWAVETLHEVSSRALSFGKQLFLHALDDLVAANGCIFDASVAGKLATEFPVHSDQIEEWMDVVSSSLIGRAGRPYGADKARRLQHLHAFYDECAMVGMFPSIKLSCTNLSVPKGYAAQLLSVNYKNNVFMHFDKYVKRLVRTRLTLMTRVEHDLAEDAPLPAGVKKRLDTDVAAVAEDLLEARAQPCCRAELVSWMLQLRAETVPAAPATRPPGWRCYQQKVHPEMWLPYMVWINRQLELEGSSKLFSPLPQRTSFVPGHVRLDTNALVDLMVTDAEEAMQLKMGLEEIDMPHPTDASSSSQRSSSSSSISPPSKYSLPGLRDKGQLYNALERLVHPSLVPTVRRDPSKHSSAFKTAIWRCLTKLGPDNSHAGLEHCDKVYNNMMDTDGHSASLHYVPRHLVGVTRFNGGLCTLKASQKKQKADEKAKGATYVTQLDEAQRQALQAGEGAVVSLDPGKKDLATATDGTGKVVRYTAAQRRAESGSREHAWVQRRMLAAKPRDSPALSAEELIRTIGTVPGQLGVLRSSKSCITLHHQQYLQSRAAVAAELSKFYSRPVFRAHRYDAHVGRRSSEDKFAARIKNEFGQVKVIFYGDWGRNPNLRHQPPSPGVALRRRLCSYFTILLVHESYTSSVCPRCRKFGLTKPRSRHPAGGTKSVPIHHLLRCSHAKCSCHWWQRDILGALNILATGKHALATGSWDPLFSKAAADAAAEAAAAAAAA